MTSMKLRRWRWRWIAAVALVLCVSGCTREAAEDGDGGDASVPPPGGVCRTTVDCPGGQFCERPVGQCDAEGKCKARPEMCTQDYTPVCGCDANTYSNACGAHAAGASIKGEGPCA